MTSPRPVPSRELYRSLVGIYVQGSGAAVVVVMFLVWLGLEFTPVQWRCILVALPMAISFYVLPDVYLLTRPEIDRRTGYHTQSILALPVINKAGKRIGVTQVLNKRGGPFTAKDESRLRALTAPIAIALENAKLFDDVLLLIPHAADHRHSDSGARRVSEFPSSGRRSAAADSSAGSAGGRQASLGRGAQGGRGIGRIGRDALPPQTAGIQAPGG